MLKEEDFLKIDEILTEMEEIEVTSPLSEGIMDLFKKNPDKMMDKVINKVIIEDYKWYDNYYGKGPSVKMVNKYLKMFDKAPQSDQEFYSVFRNLFVPLLVNYESGEAALLVIEKSKSKYLKERIADRGSFGVTAGNNPFTIEADDVLKQTHAKILKEKVALIEKFQKYASMRNLGDEVNNNVKSMCAKWKNPATNYLPELNTRVLDTVRRIKEIDKIYESANN